MKVNSGRHDDLVRVRWYDSSAVVFKHKKVRSKVIGKMTRLSEDFSLSVLSVKHIEGGPQILDCELINTGDIPVDTTKIKTYLTRSNIKLVGQRVAFSKDFLPHGSRARLRFVLKNPQRGGFTVNLWLNGERKKVIVRGALL